MVDSTVIFQSADNACVAIDIGKGSVALEQIYALSTDLDTLAGSVVVDP